MGGRVVQSVHHDHNLGPAGASLLTVFTSHEMRRQVSALCHGRMFKKVTLRTIASKITTARKWSMGVGAGMDADGVGGRHAVAHELGGSR